MLPQSRSTRRSTVAYWPTPEELDTFEKLEAIEARRRAPRPAIPPHKADTHGRKPVLAALVGGIVGHATLNALGGYFG